MTNTELLKKIEKLNEWEALIEEAKKEAEEIRNAIKDEMAERNVEEMIVDDYIVRNTSVLAQRFDTTAFKKAYKEMYIQFTKQVSSRRFSISH